MDNKLLNKIKQLVILSILTIPIFALFLVYNGELSGNDFWWHIKVGEWIYNNNSVPVEDMFSWFGTENHISWCSQEWLADLFFYLVFKSFGEIGIYCLSIFLASFLIISIIIHNYRYIKSSILFSLYFLCMMSVCIPCFMYGRPQIFSGILLYIELRILYGFYKNPKTKTIFSVPILAVAWSNLHGGTSVLSYLICIVFIVCSIRPFKNCKIYNPRKTKRYFIVLILMTILTSLAIFINPYGTYIFLYPYINISDGYMQTIISEWAAPDIKIVGQLLIYFAPFLISFLFLVLRKKKLLLMDLILFLLSIYMFLRSVRFSYYTYIIISIFIFKCYPKMKIKIEKLGAFLTFITIISLGIYSIYSVIPKSSQKIIKEALDSSYCERIKTDKVHRIFNDYNYGETLIYNNIKVFVDAREDLYANNILGDSIDLLFLQDTKNAGAYFNPEIIIDRYQFDAIVIQSDRPLKAYLDSHSDKYIKILSDEKTIYYHVARYYDK